jgi:hypothetical protein
MEQILELADNTHSYFNCISYVQKVKWRHESHEKQPLARRNIVLYSLEG